MPFLKEQIELINQHLKSGALKDGRFQVGDFNALARLAIKVDGNSKATLPVVMNRDYEAQWVGIDDQKPILVYHRKLTSQYSSAQKQQYGGGKNTLNEVSDMLMVVYANQNLIKLSHEQLEAQIITGFPDVIQKDLISPYGLSLMHVELTNSSVDSEQVFALEYRNVPFRLAPEDILLSIRYKILTQFRKNCYDFCATCE